MYQASLTETSLKYQKKVEKSVSKRIKDTEIGQREILKMIENLSSKIDTLSGQTPRIENSEVDHVDIEKKSRSTVTNQLPPLEGQLSNYPSGPYMVISTRSWNNLGKDLNTNLAMGSMVAKM